MQRFESARRAIGHDRWRPQGWGDGRGRVGQWGFTLIELLVVISILMLLISLLLPALSRARDAGRQVQCLSSQRQIATVFFVYASDHQDWINPARMRGPKYWNAAEAWNIRPWHERFTFRGPASPNDYGLVWRRDYSCPAEERTFIDLGVQIAVNSWIAGNQQSTTTWLYPGRRMEELSRPPAEVILGMDNDQIDDVHADYKTKVAFRHLSGGANHFYADGHATSLMSDQLHASNDYRRGR